ncbi:hypothetical protein KM043_005791 [Ampulex compressa]|nr:hypothetical protein KM043_005791 [Ampulex compressa]
MILNGGGRNARREAWSSKSGLGVLDNIPFRRPASSCGTLRASYPLETIGFRNASNAPHRCALNSESGVKNKRECESLAPSVYSPLRVSRRIAASQMVRASIEWWVCVYRSQVREDNVHLSDRGGLRNDGNIDLGSVEKSVFDYLCFEAREESRGIVVICERPLLGRFGL